jgi:prepilin-type processing-associated H-X9-DG protein
MDVARIPSSIVPLLGDGAIVDTLKHGVGELSAGIPTAATFTRGPVRVDTLDAPSFEEGTQREGPDGWQIVWSQQVRQDYRQFTAVHRGVCNVLMADGRVQGLEDANGDGMLNNGFGVSSEGGFADDRVEFKDKELFSKAGLRGF